MNIDQPTSIAVERSVESTTALLYEAFTERRALKTWLCYEALTIPRDGGPLCLWWKDGTYVLGEFIHLAPPNTIRMSLQEGSSSQRVTATVTLEEQATSVLVRVVLQSADGIPVDVEERMRNRWEAALADLSAVYGDKGCDPRMLRRGDGTIGRASLGFFAGPTELVESPNHPPFSKGIRVVGAIAGTSAYEEGLRKDDIVVEVAGKPVWDMFSYSHAMDCVTPGRRVLVRYVRDGVDAEARIEASAAPDSFPLPPAAASKFAEQIERLYASLDDELAELLDGVSNDVASRRPAPMAWSINEVLAHLIPFERMFHHWMTAAAAGFETYPWVEHPSFWMEGLLDVFPDLPELREELRRARRETVAYLRRLPDDLVARPTYRRMGMILLLDQFHPRHHHEQIKRILAALADHKGDTNE